MKMMNQMKSCGRGAAMIAVIALLLGTFFPLFGSTAQASALDPSETTTDSAITPEPAWGQTLVYGTVKYKDYDINGVHIGDLPLRFAKVELFQYYWVSGDEICLKTEYATDTGYFRFEFDPSPSNSENQYFVRVYSENKYAEVKDSGVYIFDSDIITIPTGGSGLQYPISFSPYPDHPAWNILDSVTEAAEWVKTRTITPEEPEGWTRPKLDVKYVDVDISKYRRSEDTIYIDTDGENWWDTIVYHEYAHAIMYDFWNNYPSSSEVHTIDRETDSGTVITEGWACFLQCAIGGGSEGFWDPTSTKLYGYELEYGGYHSPPDGWNPEIPGPPSYTPYSPSSRVGLPFGDAYIDTWDNNGNGIIDYDIIEGNFAGILWDIFDDSYTFDRFYPTDENGSPYDPYDDDGLALGFGPIWDVMKNKKPYNIYEFWDGWFQYSGHAFTAYGRHWIKAIYFNHGIDPGSSNIDSAYRFPQNAPVIEDFGITSANPHAHWIDFALKLTDEFEDLEFLRVRLEYYDDVAGNWVQFRELGISDLLPVGSYYQYNVLATVLGDGTWDIRMRVDDDMLETTSQTIQVIVDTTKPVSEVAQTSPYWRTTSPITITATASNGLSGVKEVDLYYRFSSNNQTWGVWVPYGSPDTTAPYVWSFTWPSGQGHYQFYTIAEDNAGNLEAAPTSPDYDAGYGYDGTAPSAPTPLSPTGNYGYTNSMEFTWTTVTDLSGIARYQLEYDGATVYPATNPCVLSTGSGSHTWRVRAENGADSTFQHATKHFHKLYIPENHIFRGEEHVQRQLH